MDDRAIRQILQRYGFMPVELLPIEKGYRNETHPAKLADGSLINIIIYKDEPGIVRTIRNANSVSDFLAARGFPSRQTVEDRILRLRLGGRAKHSAAYNYLPGQTIAWEAYTMKHLKLLGQTMSDMHAALRGFDARSLPDVVEVYLQIVGRMQRYFADSGVQKALAEKLHLDPPKLDEYVTTLVLSKQLPDQQALHMDFVRSNILFDAKADALSITGILDFEKTARGHLMFDIARTLAFLLVDCKYKSSDKIRKYFLQSGYQKRGGADFQNITIKTRSGQIDLLEQLITLFLLHDLYKFLRHNPYEYLLSNEHFVRTRNLLLSRGLTEK